MSKMSGHFEPLPNACLGCELRELLCQTDVTGGKYYNQSPVNWIAHRVIKFISLAMSFNSSHRQYHTHTQKEQSHAF